MLIDWLSLKLKYDDLPDWSGWSVLSLHGDRVQRINVLTGSVLWETDAWDSVRSDSHQLAIRASGYHLMIQGSPARVLGHGCTVFGFNASTRDIRFCAESMINFALERLGVLDIPPVTLFSCSRVDITKNYSLGTLANVRVALSQLRNLEGGRYKVSQQSGDTVYYSHRSRLRSGKAYAKGPHIRYLENQRTYSGVIYSDDDKNLIDSLIRLELKLGSLFFFNLRKDKINWYDLHWKYLESEHSSYFDRMILTENIGITDMNLLDELTKQSTSKGAAMAAFKTWSLIKTRGFNEVRELTPKQTLSRHLRLLRSVGLNDADFSNGQIVSFRLNPISMIPVTSFTELRNVKNAR